MCQEKRWYKMWIPKWYWESIIRQQRELERRIKRLELIADKDAQSKIAGLRNEKAGAVSKDGILNGEVKKYTLSPGEIPIHSFKL